MKEVKINDSDNKYYHIYEYQKVKNIGYNLIDQCIDNKNQIIESFNNKIQSTYNEVYTMNTADTLSALDRNDTKFKIKDIFKKTAIEKTDFETSEISTYELKGNYFLFSTDRFIDKPIYQNFIERLYPGFLNILDIEKENLQKVMSFNSLEKILQKYYKHSDDICISNKAFIKDLFNVNFNFYRKLAKLEKSLYKYNKNLYNKSNQLTIKIDKILLYNLNKSISLEALNDIIYQSIYRTFTLNDLSNYILQNTSIDQIQDILSNEEYEYEEKYKQLLNLLINQKLEDFQKYTLRTDIMYIYISDFSKKNLNKKDVKLLKILKIYNIDLNKLKDYKNFYTKNSYEIFQNKFFYLINHSKDGGKLFYKYIENNNLYNQLVNYKEYDEETIQRNLEDVNLKIETLERIFEQQKISYKDYIKKCNNFKIVKVYGNIKDLTYDNKPMIFKDPRYDSLSDNKKIMDKLKSDNDSIDEAELQILLKKKLTDIYFFDSEEDIEIKVKELNECETPHCKSYIQNNDYALLINLGSRILLGTTVQYNNEDYTVNSVNNDNTYDLISQLDDGKVFNISAKDIYNHDNHVTDLNNTKRILYKRNNHIWIPMEKEDVESNGCLISNFEVMLLNKDFHEFIDFISEKTKIFTKDQELEEIKEDYDKIGIHKFFNFQTDESEESCIPDKIYKYLYLIENLLETKNHLSEINTIKTEFKQIYNENNKYIYLNTQIKKKSVEYIDFKYDTSSVISKKLTDEYLKIQQIIDLNLKYGELLKFINRYGRNHNPDTDECKHFLYWNKDGISEKLCCTHNLDLINMIYSDDKEEALRKFVQEYSIIDMKDGNFMEDDGKYCKYCSEKICNIDDLNYINEYDLSQVEENITDSTIYEDYSPIQKKIYDTVVDLFGTNIYPRLNDTDMDFIVTQTIKLCDDYNLTNVHLNTYKLNQFIDEYDDFIISAVNKAKANKTFIDNKKGIYPKNLTVECINEIKKNYFIWCKSVGNYGDITIENLNLYEHSLSENDDLEKEYKKKVYFWKRNITGALILFNKNGLRSIGGKIIPTKYNNLICIVTEIKKLSIILSLIIFILFISEGRYTIIIGDEREGRIKNLGTMDLESILTTLLILVKNKFFVTDITSEFNIEGQMTTDKQKAIDDKFNSNKFINKFLISSKITEIKNLKQVYEIYEKDIFLKNFKQIYDFILKKTEFQEKIESRKPIEPSANKSSDWDTFRPLLKSQLIGDDININIGNLEVSIDVTTDTEILKSQFNKLGRNIIDKVNDVIKNNRYDINPNFTSYLSSCCSQDITKNSLEYFQDQINLPSLYELLSKNKQKTSFHITQQVFESNNHIDENFTLLDYMYPESKSDESDTINQDFKDLNMKTITALFSDNQTFIGKSRYFKKFFDRDLFILNEIYKKNLAIDEEELKVELARIINSKYIPGSELFVNGNIPFQGLHPDFIQKKIEIILPPYNGTFEIDMITGEFKHDIIKKINEISNKMTSQDKHQYIEEYLKYSIVLQKVNTNIIDTKSVKSIEIEYLLDKEHSQLEILLALLKKFNEFLSTSQPDTETTTKLTELETIFQSILPRKYTSDNKLSISQNLYQLNSSINLQSTIEGKDYSQKISTLKNILDFDFQDFEKSTKNIDIMLNIQNYDVSDIPEESSLRTYDYTIKYDNKKIKFLKNNIKFLLNIIYNISSKVNKNTSFQLFNEGKNVINKINKVSYNKLFNRNDALNLINIKPYWNLQHMPDKEITCVCPEYTKIDIYNDTSSYNRIYCSHIQPIDVFINKLMDNKSTSAYRTKLEKINSFVNDEYDIFDNFVKNINSNNFIYKNDDYLFTNHINILFLNFILLYLLLFIEQSTDSPLFIYVINTIYNELLFENNKLPNNENIFDEIITVKKNASLLRKKEYDDLDDESKMTKQVFRSLNLGNRFKNELQSGDEGQLTTETIEDGENMTGTQIEGSNQINTDDYSQNFDHDDDE